MIEITTEQIGMTIMVVAVLALVTTLALLVIPSDETQPRTVGYTPPPVEVTFRPEIAIPANTGLHDILDSSNRDINVDFEIEADGDFGDNTDVVRMLGKIKDIRFNSVSDTYIIVTELGVVLGGIPMEAPLRIGGDMKLRQTHKEDKYQSWACPEIGSLCYPL